VEEDWRTGDGVFNGMRGRSVEPERGEARGERGVEGKIIQYSFIY
jgi:hypothetical protein